MGTPPVRVAALVAISLLALACQSTPPRAPEEAADPAGLGLSVVTCDGVAATHVLTPGGPGTDGSWFFGTGGKDVIVGTEGDDKVDGGSGAARTGSACSAATTRRAGAPLPIESSATRGATVRRAAQARRRAR